MEIWEYFAQRWAQIKDRKRRDLEEAEDIKKRWKEYMEELYKIDLNEPDNHDSVVSHPVPNILECEVRWALESTAVSKASGYNGIPVELFNTLKLMLSKSGKPSSGHRNGKGQSSSQFTGRAGLKNVQTIGQLHSSPMIVKSCGLNNLAV